MCGMCGAVCEGLSLLSQKDASCVGAMYSVGSSLTAHASMTAQHKILPALLAVSHLSSRRLQIGCGSAMPAAHTLVLSPICKLKEFILVLQARHSLAGMLRVLRQ